MQQRILVVLNDPRAPSGVIGQSLLDLGAAYDVVYTKRAGAGPLAEPEAAAKRWSGLVVLGGVMSVNQGDLYPWLGQVAAGIRAFTAADRPVLGICLGAQLIAHAFDAPVVRMPETERGFVPLDPAPAAADDPLFADFRPGTPLMQWHEDGCRLPEGATLLLRGGAWPVQAFRVGRATYALQPHVEANADSIRGWGWSLGDVVEQSQPGFLAGLERQIQENALRQARLAREIAQRWLSLAP